MKLTVLLIFGLVVCAAANHGRYADSSSSEEEQEQLREEPQEDEEPQEEPKEQVQEEPKEKPQDSGRGRMRGGGAVIQAKESKNSKSSKSSQASQKTRVHVKAPKQRPVAVQKAPQQVQQVVHQEVPVHTQEIYHHFNPTQVTHAEVGIPHAYLKVVPMTNGAYSIPVNDAHGDVVDYVTIGDGIELVRQRVHGVNQLVVPCLEADKEGEVAFVHLGGTDGHLQLTTAHINGKPVEGFLGFDRYGKVIVPADHDGSKLSVEPIAYRVQLFSQPLVHAATKHVVSAQSCVTC